jgi:3-methyladenine DNA glycosylase AlkD
VNLIKDDWKKEDGIKFINYIEGLKDIKKIDWKRNLLKTKMSVLGIKTSLLKEIVKEIKKGNYFSFLDLNLDKHYEVLVINGYLINQITDLEVMKKYLDRYVIKIDNWSNCDLLSFNIKDKEREFYQIVLEYINSPHPFIRRVGFVILFKFIEKDEYLNKIFKIMNSFYEETNYYVNMVNAWLFCECFIKRKEETWKFLKTHQLNKFTINKGISKCRDSFRVSFKDKEALLKYKC